MSENDRPNAREFWARGVVTPSPLPSYQLEHQAEYWRVVDDKPTTWRDATEYSNDPLLSDLWRKLLKRAPTHLAQALSGTFVVKRQSWESQAATWASPHHFSGAFIDFNVGFSDATAQFATFFERIRRADANVEQLADDARRMAYVADLWRETGEVFVGDYGFTGDELTPTSIGLSLLGDVWCLAHEAAHRVLGHVEGVRPATVDEFSASIGELAATFEEPGGMELQADALATYLLRGDEPYDPDSQAAFEACFGSHLALGVLKLGDADPENGDADHPPIGRRLAFNAEVQERLTGGAYSQPVRADIEWSTALVEATIVAATAREADAAAAQQNPLPER
ncbi:M48 family metalloprotease [Nocardioides sediminis]|uniref:hypothetical protein n=1 Tax=Nocardioides sediminis TaxID=433648 RepID=UPI00131F3B63|nr:hypothetical protein [Nocardioides sediminis]